MQKEVPKGIKGLPRERVRDRKCAGVDLRSGGRGVQGSDMARCTSNLVEKIGSFLGHGSPRKLGVPRWSLRRPHEASEVIDIGEPVRTRLVIRLRSGIAEFCHLVRKEPTRDSHFIEVGIA